MTRVFFPLLVLLQLSACSVMGPSTISSSRPAYNQAVQMSNDQEMLLNLVRILYRDTTYFTNVERIAASYEFNRSVRGGLSLQSTADALSRTLNLGDGILEFNEQPTVFYAPIDGEKFVRQMLTPMNPDLLLLLVKSGWSMDRVFSIGVQEMNGLRNAPSAAGPTPAVEPIFKEFKEVVRLMRLLQTNADMELGKTPGGEGIELVFVPQPQFVDEVKRIKTLLGLDLARNRFPILSGSETHTPGVVFISTRPLISAMSYIAQGIQAPQADLDAGRVRKTQRRDGVGDFDWQTLLEGVFRVRSSATPPVPGQASVVVPYRGSFFYIADDDLDTKSTFVLLNQLMALNATPAGNASAINFTFGK
ncbi:hypothetical protein [Rhodoferax aquaticus]|uniref:Uncharacterized protein n=1 Tax=Rhodoferax aquaticus TaxID=2527691 RepID=A0A515ENG2_9BURK|nr:hypothetical protein [Rhodoferax aquaticus]QDL54203.1 hypothetical protein EXZ61_08510 [Rhodoferax aquaticus]